MAILAIGGALAVTHRFRFERPAPPPAAIPAVPVVAGTVSSHDVPIYLRGVGTVIAYNTEIVRSQIQGQLTEITFTEGQAVKAGDLLAQIDPRPYQAQLDQMVAIARRDQAQLANAIANLGRYTELANKGCATPQLVDTQKAQVAQLQSAIKADEALIEAAEVQLGYTRLTSPIAGVTGVRQIDVGNIIHPTDPNGLVVVTQIEPISLIFTLPERSCRRSRRRWPRGRSPCWPTARTTRSSWMKARSSWSTTRSSRRPAPSSSRRLSQHRASAVAGPAGQRTTARRHAQGGADHRSGGRAAGPTGSYVYVIAPDGRAQVRPITVAQISEGQALIDSGLKANETVVIDGQYRLRQDSPVRVLHGKAAQEADVQSAVEKAIP